MVRKIEREQESLFEHIRMLNASLQNLTERLDDYSKDNEDGYYNSEISSLEDKIFDIKQELSYYENKAI